MASKKVTKEPTKLRRWNEAELNTFPDVLADSENSFSLTLDSLALKKSSDNEVFEFIRK